MAEENKNIAKKAGRPKSKPIVDEVVNEVGQERLDMEQEKISIEELTNRWKKTFGEMVKIDGKDGALTVAEKWNKLNPFLQNQRIKNLYTQAKKFNKQSISEFLESPGSYETQLRSLGWANSSSQQIYYNILRRSADIPVYNWYVIPDLFEQDSQYKDKAFTSEDNFLNKWLELFNIPNTFKTIALEVKREGKSSYLFRNKYVGEGKSKEPVFTTLQKMPTEYVKITGKGQLGYTISFNMMYFLNIANSPSDFGDFIEKAWFDMVQNGIVTDRDISKGNGGKLDIGKAKNYSFEYNKEHYGLSIESIKNGKQSSYLLWLRMPFDICYTFGSDNSHPWVAPDTMGLMLKLQELTDYGQLAGLIASTPLTAVLTGEIDTIQNARAGKNESIFSPEVLQGYMSQFNQATSTNVEAWLWPAKNIKLQQLSADVNSSEIISTATENFIESAGEGGLTITDTKPNVSQIKTSQLLAASQQHYVTLQFENVMNFIIKHKLGLKYLWKIKIWGDVFSNETEKKYLKEVVANGNISLLPKLMSAEGISMRDTKALTEYIKSFDFYKDFMTYTQLSMQKAAEKAASQAQKAKSEEGSGAGRPSLDDDEIENENTAASRDGGTNTADNRDN